jgi:hypothetical protein
MTPLTRVLVVCAILGLAVWKFTNHHPMSSPINSGRTHLTVGGLAVGKDGYVLKRATEGSYMSWKETVTIGPEPWNGFSRLVHKNSPHTVLIMGKNGELGQLPIR